MKYIYNNIKLLHELVNEQFKIIGVNTTLLELERAGGATLKQGKKEKIVPWWEVYHYDNEQQEKEWLSLCKQRLSKLVEPQQLDSELDFLNLVYGLTIHIKKEGENTLF